VGLRPTSTPGGESAWRELSAAVQDEILPPAKNGFRDGPALQASLSRLDELWSEAGAVLRGERGREALWARETASLIACGRWAYASALARTESRGMHNRRDFPEPDPNWRRRVLVSGTDALRVETAEIADPVVVQSETVAA
jgi:succinate dehydrogenase/fumarate reductase flavoprotein subunit